METNKILQGDCLEQLKKLPSESINCCMTSPPYWALRDYGVEGQLGLEPTFQEYINKLCNIFDEVKRVLRKDGTCWVNIGDTYGTKSGSGFEGDLISKDNSGKGIKNGNELRGTSPEMYKNLCNIPARFSIEMQNRGWILRNVIIWHKPNCMPCSVKDRFTVDFEYLFFFVKNKKYWFEPQYEPMKQISIDRAKYIAFNKSKKTDGTYAGFTLNSLNKSFEKVNNGEINRNKRAVWTITTKPFKEAHFATYPEELCETPIKAGCPIEGIVLDPFFGAGTTGLVALKQNKKFIGIELNPKYIEIAMNRLSPYIEQTKLK